MNEHFTKSLFYTDVHNTGYSHPIVHSTHYVLPYRKMTSENNESKSTLVSNGNTEITLFDLKTYHPD